MKRMILSGCFLLLTGLKGFSQSDPGTELADRIAQKIKDSLTLSVAQRDSIYAINLQLHQQKLLVRQQPGAGDSLRIQLQRIENTRDSLYQPVIGPEKYLLYLEKKRTLISND